MKKRSHSSSTTSAAVAIQSVLPLRISLATASLQLHAIALNALQLTFYDCALGSDAYYIWSEE